jgi:transcriptional regulator with XRE-family HTH domain
MINRALGQILAAERRKLGVSQEELAFRCRLHRTYISQIERGLKSPTIGVLFELATALRTRPSALIARVEAEI